MSRCLKNRTEGLDSEDESRNEQNDQDCLEDVYLWVENIMFSIIIIQTWSDKAYSWFLC